MTDSNIRDQGKFSGKHLCGNKLKLLSESSKENYDIPTLLGVGVPPDHPMMKKKKKKKPTVSPPKFGSHPGLVHPESLIIHDKGWPIFQQMTCKHPFGSALAFRSFLFYFFKQFDFLAVKYIRTLFIDPTNFTFQQFFH